jgi:hypothetical protein
LPVCAARRNSNTIIFPVFTNVARHRRHEQTEFITVVEDCGRQLKLKIVYLVSWWCFKIEECCYYSIVHNSTPNLMSQICCCKNYVETT